MRSRSDLRAGGTVIYPIDRSWFHPRWHQQNTNHIPVITSMVTIKMARDLVDSCRQKCNLPDMKCISIFLYFLNNKNAHAFEHPFYVLWHVLNLISARIIQNINFKVWDEITCPFQNFISVVTEVQEWIRFFTSHTLIINPRITVNSR